MIRPFIITNFNAWIKTPKALDPAWVADRAAIFAKTALRSVLNQSEEDWIWGVMVNERTAPLCRKLLKQDSRIRILATKKDHRLCAEEVSKGASKVVAVRLDSDDMYHPQALRVILRWAKTALAEYAFFRSGYAYDGVQIYHYNTVGSGPFFVHVYSGEAFAERPWLSEVHHHTVSRRGADVLGAGNFMVSVTGRNTSTRVGVRRFTALPEGRSTTIIKRMFGL